ncbi:MAG: hypothetical protein ACKVP5_08610 [Aestuariivirga sp.]
MQQPHSLTLTAIFEALDRAGIAYCVTHGFEGYPECIGRDVDLIVAENVSAEKLNRLLAECGAKAGARIVRQNGQHFVLLCEAAGRLPKFLTLDFDSSFDVLGVPFLHADVILQTRRRFKSFWIPEPGTEFSFRLARGISKHTLTPANADRLHALLQEDRTACSASLNGIWEADSRDMLIAAAETGDWQPVLRALSSLHGELYGRCAPSRGPFLAHWLGALGRRIEKLSGSRGYHLVLLGTDGAGKSSVIAELEATAATAFSHVEVLGFPAISNLWKRGSRNTSTPHNLTKRGAAISSLRALFWLAYNLASHVTLRLAKARGVLILNDRHYLDILVDPVRYRYGGPAWLLRLAGMAAPEPDAFVLLNGPPEVIHVRKKELPLEETARQCRDYLELVRLQTRGHTVNAAQSFNGVMHDIYGIVFPEKAAAANPTCAPATTSPAASRRA